MKLILTLFLSLLPVFSFAQSLISGKIIDDKKLPIPFCNILLIDPDGKSNYGGSTTDEKGTFEIETVKKVLFKKLINVYQLRIEYPK